MAGIIPHTDLWHFLSCKYNMFNEAKRLQPVSHRVQQNLLLESPVSNCGSETIYMLR